MIRRSIALLAVLFAACEKGEQAGQSAQDTARNLTLASPESTVAPREVQPQPQPAAPATTPAKKPPASRPAAPKPAAPLTVAEGTEIDLSVADTISSRSAQPGDAFTAQVVEDVRDRAGRVIVPAGSVVRGTVVDAKPAPNPREAGTLTLAVSTITIRGVDYPIEASIDSLETERHKRGVSGGDAAKVGVGAAAGAIAGRIIGGNKKGTIIGGVVGAAAGAGVAAATKDVDVVLPAGAHVHIRLTKSLSVRAR